MLFTSFFQKTDSLNAQLLSGGTSATLLTGNFGSPSGKQILVIDRAVAGKAEVVSCNIAGTALTNLSRGLSGTSAVQHEVGATVEFVFEPTLFDALASFDGWTKTAESFTRTSGTTGTFPVDVTSWIGVGTKLKVTDTTTKYFYVTAASFGAGVTTITFTGGTDYTLAGNPTVFWYSNQASPIGFPQWFAYTPTLSAGGSMTYTSTIVNRARFSITGRMLNYDVDFTGTTGGSANNSIIFTVPVARSYTNSYSIAGYGTAADGSDQAALVLFDSTQTGQAIVQKTGAANWGLGSARRCILAGTYQI